MRRLHLVSWLAAALLVAACGSSGGGGGGGNSYSGKTIKLGAILSISGAGGVYGPQSRDGMKLAGEQINVELHPAFDPGGHNMGHTGGLH